MEIIQGLLEFALACLWLLVSGLIITASFRISKSILSNYDFGSSKFYKVLAVIVVITLALIFIAKIVIFAIFAGIIG
jgi:hypothetical protein